MEGGTRRRTREGQPFAAFHRRERQQRLESLNPADRLILSFAKVVVANKHARLFLVGYIVCMHLVTSGAMYVASHHCWLSHEDGSGDVWVMIYAIPSMSHL